MTPSFHKRPPSVPIFTKCKTAKEDRCFHEERQTTETAFSAVLQRALPEAARPRSEHSSPGSRLASSAPRHRRGPGPWASVLHLRVFLYLYYQEVMASLLTPAQFKASRPSTTEPGGCHLSRDTTGSSVSREALSLQGRGRFCCQGGPVRSEGPPTPRSTDPSQQFHFNLQEMPWFSHKKISEVQLILKLGKLWGQRGSHFCPANARAVRR